MKRFGFLLIAVFFAAMMSTYVSGQISMTTTGSNTQNFNSLVTTGSATFSDNSTIPNWYSQRTGTGTTYTADAGTNTAGGLYSYGTGTNADRALGTIGSSNAAAGNFAHGVLLRNTSGVTITNITVSYTLEQWRNSAAVGQSLTVYYKTSSSIITSLTPNSNGTWTQVSGLTLTNPVTGGTASAIDGNNTSNKVSASNIAITSLSLANNDYLMIKWEDPDHTGTDHGLAIDDVTVNWTVPPSINVVGGPLTFANTAVGYSSAEQTYTVSGSNLTADITVVAPTDFQVSTTSGSGFGSSVTLTQSGGSVSTTTIYVRFAPGSTGSKTGNVTNASTGATTQNVAVSGTAVLPKYRSTVTGNWNTAATWEVSADGTTWAAATTTPTASTAEEITVRNGHTVTVTAGVSADQLTVDSGGQVSVNSGVTFTIADGTGTDLAVNGTLATTGTVTNNGQVQVNNVLQINQGGFPGTSGTYSYDSSNGTLVFNNSSGSYGVDSTHAYWPASNGPQNVTVQGAGGITMNVARTVGVLFQTAAGVTNANNLTLNGTAQINNGGFFLGSPTYGSSSLLKYNTGGSYGIGNEWETGSSGAGVPQNVQISTAGTTLSFGSISASRTARGNVIIDSDTTLQLSGTSGGDLNIGGNWTNNGTFLPNSRIVTFNGTAAQSINGTTSTTFNALTLNNSNGLTLNLHTAVSGLLTLTSGDIVTGSYILTQSGTDNNGLGSAAGAQGDVVGTVRRFDMVVNTPRAFGNVDNLIYINTGSVPTQMDVTLYKSAGTLTPAIKRLYSLTPTFGVSTPIYTATVRLRYLDSEVTGSGVNEDDTQLYRYNGTIWVDGSAGLGTDTRDVSANWAQTTLVTAFSSWAIGGTNAPTLVRIKEYNAYRFDEGNLLRWRTGYETNNLGFVVYRQDGHQRTRLTPQIVAGSALTFGSKVTLTAGQSYAWWDKDGAPNSVYWVEDIDLDGTRTLHGPLALHQGEQALAQLGNSPTLDELRPASEGTGRIEAPLLPQSLQNSTARPTPNSDAWTRQLQLAAQSAVKLAVRQNGWYRVGQSQLAAAGLPANADARLLQLYLNGVQVPLAVRTANGTDAGPLGATGVIEFYGLAQDAVETESNTYWLITGTEPGLRFGAPVRVAPTGGVDGENGTAGTSANANGKDSAAVNRPAPDATNRQSFAYTVERKDRSYYLGNVHNGAAGNFFGTIITPTASNQTVRVNQLDPSATDMATVTVAIQGFTERPHRIQVALNGNNLGVVTLTSQEHKVARFNVVPSALQEGDNTITMRALEGDEDVSATDYVRITYARRFTAEQNRLLFTTGNRQGVAVSGFTAANVRVFDVTDTGRYFEVASKTVSDAGGYTTTVSGNLNSRTLLAVADETALTPASITANAPSSWTTSAREADFVILTPEAFRSAVEPLANLRRGQGLRTEVIAIEDIYDEWNAGAKGGDALRSFLEWSRTNWQTAPQYVLLVGDASFDPRNYLGYGATDVTPTLYVDTPSFETASDDALVDFNNDGVPEMSIGRLPGRTLAQVAQLITRTVNYQVNPNGGAAFIADRPEGYDFAAINQEARNLLPQGMTATMINRAGQADATVRSQIVNAINAGPSIVQYAGHGSIEVWTEGNLLDEASLAALTNNNRLSVFVMMTCLNGYFHDVYSESLAERLMRAPNGGAVAVWASSTLTDTTNQAPMDKELFRLLYANGNAPRLGDAMRQAKAATTNGEVRRTWILFGDPTLRVY